MRLRRQRAAAETPRCRDADLAPRQLPLRRVARCATATLTYRLAALPAAASLLRCPADATLVCRDAVLLWRGPAAQLPPRHCRDATPL